MTPEEERRLINAADSFNAMANGAVFGVLAVAILVLIALLAN